MTLTYLTYLEPISGVYEGQVVDVCAHLEAVHGVPVQLVAVLSPRDFETQRDKLIERAPGAIAIRSWFGWRGWPLARIAVRAQVARAIASDACAVLARGPIATWIALGLKTQGRVECVGYDGRGAISAEWSEYAVAPSDAWKTRVAEIERKAVLASDMRIAVSTALVGYWRDTFGYAGNGHVVIPCTLSAHHVSPVPDQDEIARRRATFGFALDQKVICYAGSEAEWQSIDKLGPWLDTLLSRDPSAALLMMTRADLSASQVVKNHPDRVRQTWVNPDRVREAMEMADFGLLVRDRSTTNRVAAPTKFAEYLAAGLKIMISPEVGDYSEMVQREELGVVCDLSAEPPPLVPPGSGGERLRLMEFASQHFMKSAYDESYESLLAGLGVLSTGPSSKKSD